MTSKDRKAELLNARLENFNRLCSDMSGKNYRAVSAVYPGMKAYWAMICCAVPFIVLILAVYLLRSSMVPVVEFPYENIVFIPAFVLSVFVHEYLHGVGWRLAGKLDKSHVHITLNAVMPL